MSEKYNVNLKAGYEVPINSGMISLVFKAYDKETGKPLIIKLKRNNIDNKLNDSIKNLQTFMYLLSFIPIINKWIFLVNKNPKTEITIIILLIAFNFDSNVIFCVGHN